MTDVLHQKGANGLVAEYRCAVRLNELLSKAGARCLRSQESLETELHDAIRRVANELSDAQITRALNQGDGLADYIFASLAFEPSRLGIDRHRIDLAGLEVEVSPTGRLTSSGSSADLILSLWLGEPSTLELPISLKAYRGTETSLGSKSARASLCRLFLAEDRVTDPEFLEFFGEAGRQFIEALADFKRVAKDFYDSDSGRQFVDAYEARKGTRRVNNPLRRKEVGDYFERLRGYKSEHLFAELYVKMFQHGMERILTDGSELEWARFLESARFILGMDRDILTLNAIAGADGTVIGVENSFLSGAYASVRMVLVEGCEFILTHKPGSSIIGVLLRRDEMLVHCLNLAIWKDATIQFKLDTKVVS